jgi:DNA polymerase-1
MANLIVVDSNFVCYKSMVAMKGLSWHEHATGVIFGFLRQVQQLTEEFPDSRFIFTWDSVKSFRRDQYPEYKKRPKSEDPEMEDLIRVGKPQFSEIRFNVLPKLGFNNNFIQYGIEADDLIAHVVKDYAWEYDHTYIISSDEDLYQLLHEKISIYNPRAKKMITKESFMEEKGIFPDQWPWVKAVAGCTSDNVKGISGVGETTAIKYLLKELKPGKKYDDIERFDIKFNMSLVELPYFKSRPIYIVDDTLNFDEFESICLDYGFNSLLKKDTYNKWRQILCP